MIVGMVVVGYEEREKKNALSNLPFLHPFFTMLTPHV